MKLSFGHQLHLPSFFYLLKMGVYLVASRLFPWVRVCPDWCSDSCIFSQVCLPVIKHLLGSLISPAAVSWYFCLLFHNFNYGLHACAFALLKNQSTSSLGKLPSDRIWIQFVWFILGTKKSSFLATLSAYVAWIAYNLLILRFRFANKA